MPSPLRRFFRMPQEMSANEFNASIPESIEKDRETAILVGMQAQGDAGFQRDLKSAEEVRAARNRGFSGTYPLQDQDDYAQNQKLRQILLPKQMELESEQTRLQQQQDFMQQQNGLNRSATAANNQARVEAATTRQQSGQAHAISLAQQKGQIDPGSGGVLAWLKSLGGGDEAPPAAPSTDGGVVNMIDPSTGEIRPVPAHLVNRYLAKGGQVVP